MSAEAAALPATAFLGQIVPFTITDTDVDLTRLRAVLKDKGLRTDTVKRRIRRVDAFKRATSEIAVKFPRYEGHETRLRVREVGQDAQESHRVVVYERAHFRSGQQRRVQNETIYRIMYDRGTRTADGSTKDDHIAVEQQIVQGLVLADEERAWIASHIGPNGDALRARFEHHSTHIDNHGVRTFVREYLANHLDAVNVKGSNSGGLYFVPQVHVNELSKLAEVVRSIDSSMHCFAVLVLPEAIDTITDAANGDLSYQANSVRGELAKMTATSSRRVHQSTQLSYETKADALLAKAAVYEKLLGRPLSTARRDLNELKREVDNLAQRVRSPLRTEGSQP